MWVTKALQKPGLDVLAPEYHILELSVESWELLVYAVLGTEDHHQKELQGKL